MAQPDQRDDWELKVETCRVELWRGGLTSTFIARLLEGDGAGAIVESSSAFRCRRDGPPDTQEARLAHYELVSRLKAGGWSPNGIAGEWYETELVRPTLVPPTAALVEAPPAPEPPPPPAVVRSEPPAPAPVAPAAPRDRWRAIAVAGLLAAVALLVFLALHGVG